MKVKELISKLNELNPDANIWLLYDRSQILEPEFTKMEKDSVCTWIQDKINNNDFYFDAY